MDEATQLRLDQARARRTRTSTRRPFIPHVCSDCVHPRPLDRDRFRATFEAARQEARGE